MTEREKAAAGFLYDANYDEELARQRAECKDKCHRYNLCLPSDMAQQDEIMRGILARPGMVCASPRLSGAITGIIFSSAIISIPITIL